MGKGLYSAWYIIEDGCQIERVKIVAKNQSEARQHFFRFLKQEIGKPYDYDKWNFDWIMDMDDSAESGSIYGWDAKVLPNGEFIL